MRTSASFAHGRRAGPQRALLATLAALLIAACGGGDAASAEDPEAAVREVVMAFGEATAAKDYRRLCDSILAPALVDELSQVGLPCTSALREGLGEVRDPRLSVGEIRVQGDRASAEIQTSATGQEPSRDRLRLQRVAGRWRIASLTS